MLRLNSTVSCGGSYFAITPSVYMKERPYSILVVGEEDAFSRLLEKRLGADYGVQTAAGVDDVLSRTEATMPDVIVCNLALTNLDGFDLWEALKKNVEPPSLPFILLSDSAHKQLKRRARVRGIRRFFTKPVDIDALVEEINRACTEGLLDRLFYDDRSSAPGLAWERALLRVSAIDHLRTLFYVSPDADESRILFEAIPLGPSRGIVALGHVGGTFTYPPEKQMKSTAVNTLLVMHIHYACNVENPRSPASGMKQIKEGIEGVQTTYMHDSFLSLLLIDWDSAHHRITYANAGACRLVLITAEKTEVLAYRDQALGLNSAAAFTDATIHIPPGGALLAYTASLLEHPLKEGGCLSEALVLDAAARGRGATRPLEAMAASLLDQCSVDTLNSGSALLWLQRDD